MLLKSPWETEDSQTVKDAAFLELPYYKALYQLLITRNRAPAAESCLANPWWKESIRSEKKFIDTTIRWKIACYCLTDKLSELMRRMHIRAFFTVTLTPTFLRNRTCAGGVFTSDRSAVDQACRL